MPTISDIAKKAGVSTATVSRYMNQSGYVGKKASIDIDAAIKALDYTPNAAAVSLSKKTSNVIGVMVPEISNPFFSKIIEGISKEADAKGYVVMIFDTNESQEKELATLKVLKKQTICGLLITPVCDAEEKNPEFYDALKKSSFPIVFMDREVEHLNASGVYYDNLKGMQDLTQSLVEEGHDHIALVAGDENLKLSKDRTEGYKNAVSKECIIYGDFNRTKAKEAVLELLKNEHPSAIVSSNNVMTEGIIQALYESNHKDIVIASFDEIPWAKYIGMDIKHLKRKPSDMGHHAVNLLMKQLKDNTIEKIYIQSNVQRSHHEI